MRRTLLALLLLCLWSAGVCAPMELEDIHKSLDPNGLEEFDLNTIECAVDLAGGTGETVQIDITKNKKLAFEWKFDRQGSVLRVREKSRKMIGWANNGECRAVVRLPRDIAVTVTSVSGKLKLSGLAGKLAANTTSGGMDIDASGGEPRIATVSGNVAIRGLAGSLRYKGVSGNLDAVWMRLPVKAAVAVRTVSGEVLLRLPQAGKIALETKTVSGNVRAGGFTADASAGFAVKMESVSGNLTLVRQDR